MDMDINFSQDGVAIRCVERWGEYKLAVTKQVILPCREVAESNVFVNEFGGT